MKEAPAGNDEKEENCRQGKNYKKDDHMVGLASNVVERGKQVVGLGGEVVVEEEEEVGGCIQMTALSTTLTEDELRLFSAIKSKDVQLVRTLLRDIGKHGPEEGARRETGGVAGRGAEGGAGGVVGVDSRRKGIDMESRNEEGHTYLGIACKDGSLDIVQLLIERGANLNGSDFFSYSPLQYAAGSGQLDIVHLLIAAGADVNFMMEDRLSALHTVACKGLVEVCKILIAAKCNVNIVNMKAVTTADHCSVCYKNGATPLHAFCYRKKGVTPLHCAISNGHHGIVRLLLENNAAVNVKGQKTERTPLFMAGEVGDIEGAKLLLQYGAKLNLTDKYGMTPLNVVCNRNNQAVARLFIEAGSKVNLADRSGAYPLHYAARNGDDIVVQLLLENDAKVDVLNKDGESPLHFAVRLQHEHIVKLLVDYNCDVNICCPETGITPLYIAVSGYTDPVQFEQVLLLLLRAYPSTVADDSQAYSETRRGCGRVGVGVACNLNCRTTVTQETPLYRALDTDKADIALVLLQHGADAYVECPHEVTIFNKACQRCGSSSFMEALTVSSWAWRRERWLVGGYSSSKHGSGLVMRDTGLMLGHFLNEVPLDAPVIFWNKSSLYWRIQDWLSNTLTLQQCCRLVIRSFLPHPLYTSIQQLHLPQRLNDYLMIRTI